jgi:hypothetical protein
MGRIICSKHGGTGIALTCSHISDAVSNKIRINLCSINEEFLGAHWLCSDCLKIYKDNTHNDEFVEDFFGIFQPVCSQCFREWKELHNIVIIESHDISI